MRKASLAFPRVNRPTRTRYLRNSGESPSRSSALAARGGVAAAGASRTRKREDGDGGQARHDRQKEYGAEGDPARQEEERRHGPEHRPEVIHRPLQPERLSPLRGGNVRGHQRVPRGGPHPFPDPVAEAHGEDVSPSGREPHERPGKGGEAVSRENQRFLPSAPVGPGAGEELEQARRRLRDPLDQSEGGGAGGQGDGEEDRQERVDHLARQVGEKAHQPEGDDVPVQLRAFHQTL